IWRYAVDPNTGAIQTSSATPFAAGSEPTWLAMDRSKHFVYASDIAANQVLGYSLDLTTGALTPVPGSPFPTGVLPNSITADPGCGFIYVPFRGGRCRLCIQGRPSDGSNGSWERFAIRSRLRATL